MHTLLRRGALAATCFVLTIAGLIGSQGVGKAGLGASSLVADVVCTSPATLTADFMLVDGRSGRTLWVATRGSISATTVGDVTTFSVTLPPNAPTGSGVERVFRLNATRTAVDTTINRFVYKDSSGDEFYGTFPLRSARGQIVEANQR